MKDQRTIVVGASRGIGAALTRKLAQQGHKLILLSRSEAELEKLCAELNQKYGEGCAEYRLHDVLDVNSVRAVFDESVEKLGGLDNLMFVSGVMQLVNWHEFELEKEMQMMNVNLLGGVAWTGIAGEYFKKQGGGQIVGIGSVAGVRGRGGNPAYNSSKAGLHVYLESLRNRLFRYGVRVLTVLPGYTDTDMISEIPTAFGVASPERVANDIWRAIKKKKQVICTPWWWAFILWIVSHTPSFIFRRIKF